MQHEKPEAAQPLDLQQETIPEVSEESTYRRGYKDGWIAAVHALSDLMFQAGASRRNAIQAGFNHWQDELLSWERRATDENHIEIPPKVKVQR